MSAAKGPAGTDASQNLEGQALRAQVLEIIAQQGMVERADLRGEATLDELGVQSVEVVMILNELEDVFGIYIPIDQSIADVRNIDDLVALVVSLVEKSQADPSGESAGTTRP